MQYIILHIKPVAHCDMYNWVQLVMSFALREVQMTDGTPDSEGTKTADNKQSMRDYMHSQFHPLPTGGTDFMKGFAEAFQLYLRTGWGGRTLGLQTAVHRGGLVQIRHSIECQDMYSNCR